jgi:DNA-binding SARP family transcriptional activator
VQEELPAAPPATLQLQLLGGFGLESAGGRIRVAPTVQRVVAFVALRPRPVLRSFVAGSLWPEVSERRAGANLRAALWRLPDCGDLLDSSRTEVALHSAVDVDFRTALTSAREVIDGRAGADRPPDAGLALDLLPGWDDEWVVLERERLRQLRLHALEAVCRALLDHGETARAIDLALVVADDEPDRESVQRILVTAHLAEGNQLEALRTYERYRDRVQRALGLDPSALMEAVIGPLRAPAPA